MFRRYITRGLPRAASLRSLLITPIPMPALSPTMEKGKVTEWLKSVGDSVTSGDTWCKVETDKAVVSYDNATEEGFLARILVQPGEEIAVGDAVCLLVDEAADVNAAEVKNWTASGSGGESEDNAKAPEEVKKSEDERKAPETKAGERKTGDRVKASPLARRTAKEMNVALDGIAGTGGGVGRIVKKDILAAAAAEAKSAEVESADKTTATQKTAAKTTAAKTTATTTTKSSPAANENYTDIPVTSMRMTIAKRLTQSKNTEIPHYYIFEECCVDNMMALIHQLNAKGDGAYKITVNDYLIKALARANMIVPAANSSWQGDIIRQYNTVDVSVAVATPTGLITPIVKNAHVKGLAEISTEMKGLAKKARDGTLQPNEYIGGTVSISNLGSSGIPGFTAIINPPQSLIVAVGSAKPRAKVVLNEETGKYSVSDEVEMTVKFSISFDHRVIDGAVGAQWCKHFKDAVENPLSLLL